VYLGLVHAGHSLQLGPERCPQALCHLPLKARSGISGTNENNFRQFLAQIQRKKALTRREREREQWEKVGLSTRAMSMSVTKEPLIRCECSHSVELFLTTPQKPKQPNTRVLVAGKWGRIAK
jgi:hypothetical protein